MYVCRPSQSLTSETDPLKHTDDSTGNSEFQIISSEENHAIWFWDIKWLSHN